MSKIAFISTYPPRQCGIATYTQDVLRAVRPHCKRTGVIAMDDGQEAYPKEVMLQISEKEREAYRQAADWLNQQDVDIVHLQHEFGIFGGDDGRWILDLLANLEKPTVATFHTILPRPTTGQQEILSHIGQLVERAVVMSTAAAGILQKTYGIDPSKIELIRHGAPAPAERRPARRRLGIPEDQTVVSTFGLIGPGKGLEHAVEAIGRLVPHHPDVHYYILGRTHPKLLEGRRDTYRESLQSLIKKLGIAQNVHFADRYLDLEELIQWLAATDIYVTPYPGRDQITSGTLTYAVAAGKAVVSTPYLYARDLLGERRGVLVDFDDLSQLPGRLAEAIGLLVEDPQQRYIYEQRALTFGRSFRWPEVGARHASLYRSIVAEAEADNSLQARLPSSLQLSSHYTS